MALFPVLICIILLSIQAYGFHLNSIQNRFVSKCTSRQLQKDEKGYIIKDRDWFEGLSLDAGAR